MDVESVLPTSQGAVEIPIHELPHTATRQGERDKQQKARPDMGDGRRAVAYSEAVSGTAAHTDGTGHRVVVLLQDDG